MKELIIAIGLLFFIEGILYALFPSKMKNMLKNIEKLPINQLRISGFLFALIGFGPKITPPPFHNGELLEPARARPVPFCFQGLRPPPATSLRVLVEAVFLVVVVALVFRVCRVCGGCGSGYPCGCGCPCGPAS